MDADSPSGCGARLLDEAERAEAEEDWALCASKAKEAIRHLGACPTTEWVWARLTFAIAVSMGDIDDEVELGLARAQEAHLAIADETDKRNGTSHRVLAYLYESRGVGTAAANLSLAIDHFERAADYFRRESDPIDWAELRCASAMCHRKLLEVWADEGLSIAGSADYSFRRSTLVHAMDLLDEALEIFDEERYPEENRQTLSIQSGYRLLLSKLPQKE